MVAIITGSELGLHNTTGLNNTGPSTNGRGNERIYVNSTTGNLVVQNTDEYLSALGPDLALVRTYNSQGQVDGDNNDNWRIGVYRRVFGLTGTLNTAGSTVTKTFGDGAELVYTYNAALGRYIGTGGPGAHDTLQWNGTHWIWTDGNSRLTETYDSGGRLLSVADTDGNRLTYAYTGNLVTSITDASGQVTYLDYSGNNLTQIRVVSQGQTQTLTRYFYDDLNRLSQVVVDLSPEDNTIPLRDSDLDGVYDTIHVPNQLNAYEPHADRAQTHVTRYTYDGDSNRIASIHQADGIGVRFTYAEVNGTYRVASITDALNRTTTFDYTGAGEVTHTLNTGVLSTPTVGWLTPITLEGSLTAASDPLIAFDQNGDGFAVWRQGGDVYARRYTRATDSWSNAVTLDSRSNTVAAVSLAVDRSGSAIVTWVQSNGTANSTYVNRYDAATQSWSGAALLESSSSAVTASVAAINVNGKAVVLWIQGGSVYASVFNGSGWSAPSLLESSSGTAGQPAVAIDNEGNVAALWQQANSIYASRYDAAAGSWSGATLFESSSTAANDPRVAFDQNGNALAIWRQGGDLYARRYTRASNAWSAQVTLDSRSNTVYSPALAMQANGDAVVAWVQSDGAANSVYASRYNSASNTWSGATLLETSSWVVRNTTGSVTVSMTNGRIAVGWIQADLIADVFRVARWNGSAWSTDEAIQWSIASASQPSLSIDATGNIGAVWMQSDGFSNSIYTNRYNADTTPYYLIPSGATWASVAAALYGTSAVAGQLQATLGNPPLTAGGRLTNLPATLITGGNAVRALNPGTPTTPVTSWSEPELLEKIVGYAHNQQVAFDNQGNAWAVWDQRQDLFARYYDAATQTWSAPQLLETNSNVVDWTSITVEPTTGHAIVAWVQYSNGYYSVIANRYDPSTKRWSGAVRVAGSGPVPRESRAAINASGHAVIAWLEDGNLYAARFDGTEWSVSLLEASADTAARHSVAIDNQGNIAIVWQQAGSIYVNRFTASAGAWGGAELLESIASVANDPSIAFDQNGNGLAVWRQGSDVYARRYDGATNTWEPQVAIDASGYVAYYPILAMQPNGDAVVAWVQSDGTANSVYASRYDAATNSWSTPALLESSPTAVRANPGNFSVSMRNGRIAIAWLQVDVYYYSLYVARWDGTSWSAPELLESRRGNVAIPDVAIADDGSIVAIWGQNDDTDFSTYVSHYRTQATPYYDVPAGATWASIATALYGTAAVADELQAALGNPPLTAGTRLLGLPGTLTDHDVVSATDTHVTDPLGNVTTYRRDSAGRLIAVLSPAVDGKRLETRYTYDANGNLTSIVEDPSGLNRVTTYQYDNNGNVVLIRDAAGNTITRTYSGTNQLLTETQYLVADPDGAGGGQPGQPITTRYVYDAEDHLRFVVSAEGRVTEHQYLASGQLFATARYTGGYYNVSGLAPTATLSESQLAAWAATQAPNGIEWVHYSYDFRGQLSMRTVGWTPDGVGNGNGAGGASVTHYVYDQRGRLIQTIDPRGQTTSDPNDYVTTYTYDGLGRLLTANEWIGGGVVRTTYRDYLDTSNRTVTWHANGHRTESIESSTGEVYEYRQRGYGDARRGAELTERLVRAGYPVTTSDVWTDPWAYQANREFHNYYYDALGRTVVAGQHWYMEIFALYDEAGRKVGEVDADGSLVEFIYDDANRLIKTVRYAARIPGIQRTQHLEDPLRYADGFGKPVTLDDLRPLVSANPGEDRITRIAYDAAGRVAFEIDGEGAVTRYVYDGAGRLTDVIQYANPVTIDRNIDQLLPGDINVTPSADDRRTRHFYDNDGLLRATLDAAGYLTENIYDGAGRLIERVAYANPTPVEQRASGTLAQLRPALDEETTVDFERDQRTRFFYDHQGRQTGVLDAEGYLTETVYDLAGNVTRTIRYDSVVTYTPGATLDILRPSGVPEHVHLYEYDGLGRLIRETDAQGTVTTYEYDMADNVITKTVAAGTEEARTVRMRYDSRGYLVHQLSAEGSALLTDGMTPQEVQEIWDNYGVRDLVLTNGVPNSTVDPNGFLTVYGRDEELRSRYVVNPEWEIARNEYNAFGERTAALSYTDRWEPYTYHFFGNFYPSDATYLFDPNATVDTYYNRPITGRVTADPARDTHKIYGYTRRGELASVTNANPEGESIIHLYNAFGEERERLTAIDATTVLRQEYLYDKRGLLTTAISDPDGLNVRETRTYDAFGRVTSITDANGNVTRYEYDRLGRMVATIDAHGRTTMTYDALGRVLTVTDRLNQTTTYEYFDSQRTVQMRTPEGLSVVTTHNAHGQTLYVTTSNDSSGGGNTTTYQYDLNGNLLSVSDNLGTLESRSYDRAGRQLTATDAEGAVTRFTYDGANRVLTRTVDENGLSLTTTYIYDGQGRVIRTIDPDGRVTATDYDSEGRVTEVAIDPDGANLRTRYTYDRTGNVLTVTEGYGSGSPRVTEYRYDVLGRRTHEIRDPGGLNLTTEYRYDANGNVTRAIDARGHSTWYVYDEHNRLTHTVNHLGEVTAQRYDLEGRLIETRTYANRVDTAGWGDVRTSVPTVDDPRDQRVLTAHDHDGRVRYTITGAGNVTELTYNAAGNISRTRGYAKAIVLPANPTIAAVEAALIAAGNDIANVAAADAVTYNVYSNRNQVIFTVDGTGAVTEYRYDDNGNVTDTIGYVARYDVNGFMNPGALTGFASANAGHSGNYRVTYAYDGAGRVRMTTDATGVRTLSLYDGLGRLIATVDGDGSLVEFVYGATGKQIKTVRYAQQIPVSALAGLIDGTVEPDATALAALKAAIGRSDGPAATDPVSRQVYDEAGLLRYSIDPSGAVTKSVYDKTGRLIETIQYATRLAIAPSADVLTPADVAVSTHADDRRTRFFYDASGNLLATLDAERYLTEHVYDAAGRLTHTIAYANRVVDYAVNGTLAQVRPALDESTADDPERDANTYTFYDAQGRVVGTLDAEGYLTETEYDSAGRIAATVRYDQALTYSAGATFDSLRAAVVSFSARHGVRYEYDGLGRVRREIATRGREGALDTTTTEYDYDRLGNVVRRTQALGKLDLMDNLEERATQTRYDVFGRVSRELSGEGSVILAHLLSLEPNATQAQIDEIWDHYGVTYRYDAAGRRISATITPNGEALTTYYYYDNDGRVRFEVNPAGEVREHNYNALNQLVETVAYTNRINTAALTGGLLTPALVDQLRPAPDGGRDGRVAYTYTLTGQLESATTGSGSYSTVSYNAFGEVWRRTARIDSERVRVDESQYDRRGLLTLARSDIGPQGLNVSESYEYDAFGRLVAHTDARLNTTRTEYDRLGRTIALVDPFNRRVTNTYDAFGRVLTTTDALNATTTFLYEDSLNVTVMTTPEGVQVWTVGNSHGQELAVLSQNNLTTFYYDADGRLLHASDNLGTLESREYDSAGRQTHGTDANGVVTAFTYDAASRVLTRTADANGLALQTVYEYDGQGRVTRVTEPNGVVTRTEYDNDGRVREIAVDPDGLNLRTRFGYDHEGRTVTVIEGYGSSDARTTEYRYDALGRRTHEIRDPGGLNLTTEYRYDANGNLTRKIDARGNSTWYVYDAKNRQTHVVDAEGNVVTKLYDANDRMFATRAHATRIDTSSFGDVVTLVAAPVGEFDRIEQTAYDADGRPVYSIDGMGTVTERTFDAEGNVTRVRVYANPVAVAVYPSAAMVETALTQAGNNVATVSPQDHVQWSAYDARGRMRFTQDATGAVVAFEYDANGNVIERTAYAVKRATAEMMDLYGFEGWAAQNENDVRNQTTRYWYDGANRARFTLDPEGYLQETRYDDAGRTRTEAVYEVRPTVPANATLAQVTAAAAAIASVASDRVTIARSDAAGRLVEIVDAEGYLTRFAYDAAGSRTETRVARDLAGTDWSIRRSYYDAAGRQVYTLTAENYLTQYIYNGLDQVETKIVYDTPVSVRASGDPVPVPGDARRVTRYVYNEANRLVRETREYEAGEIHTDYEYDARGNLILRTDAADSADARATAYRYDTADRLYETTEAYGTSDAVTTHMVLDAFGNVRTRYDAYATVDQRTTSFLYDQANRLLSETNALGASTINFRDAFGNIERRVTNAFVSGAREHTFVYDRNNRLVSETNAAGETTQYRYDAAGNRTHIISAHAIGLTSDDGFGSIEQAFYYFEWRMRLGVVDQYGAPKAASDMTAAERDLLIAAASTVSQYDRNNRLVAVIDPNGVETRYVYDGAGNKTDTFQAYGIAGEERHTIYQYDKDNRLRHVYDPMGGHTDLRYDVLGNVVQEIDANGNQHHNHYDRLGRLSTSIRTGASLGHNGIKTVNVYDRRGNIVSTTQSFGDDTDARTTTYRYDLHDRKVLITDGEGFSTFIDYDDFGNQRVIIAGLYLLAAGDAGYDADKASRATGVATAFTYDALDRMLTMADGAGQVTEYRYDAFGNRTHVVEGNAVPLVTSDDPYYREMRYRLGVRANGQGKSVAQLTETDRQALRDAVTTVYTYDPADRLTALATPAGGRETYLYDLTGNKIAERVLQSGSESSGVWIEKRFEYDANDRLVAEIDPYQTRTEHVYDAVGNEIWTHFAVGTADARSVGMEYDLNNRKTADIDGLGHRTEYEYDALGNRIKVTDALGHVARYYYDGANRLISILDPEGYINRFRYDASGNRTREYVYDIRYTGPVSDTEPPTPTTDTNLIHITSLYYDGANRLVMRLEPDSITRTDYVYDGAGRKIREVKFAVTGPRTMHYQYDSAGRLASFRDVDDTVTTFGYDASNNRILERISNPADTANPVRETRYAYDTNNRRIRETFDPAGLNIVRTTRYDHVGNVVETSVNNHFELAGGVVGGIRVERHAYDLNNREVTYTQGFTTSDGDVGQIQGYGILPLLATITLTTSYGYDRIGNRTSVTDANGNVTEYRYDANNRLTHEIKPRVNSYTIGAGVGQSVRPTTINRYDAVGNLVQVIGPRGVTYDASGNPVLGAAPTGHVTTRYYDGNGNMVAEINADNAFTEYEYNAGGLVTRKVEHMLRLPLSTHDPMVRPTALTPDHVDDHSRETTYLYDKMGRLRQTTLPEALYVGEVVNQANGNPYVEYSVESNERHVYDAFGNEVETFDRNGNRTVSYYDVKGRKVAQVDGAGYLVEWDYDAQDNVIEERVYPGPIPEYASTSQRPTPTSTPYVTTRVYDAASRLIREIGPEIEVFDPDTQTSSLMRPVTEYTYDEAGNVMSMTVGAGTAQARTEYYYYDAANRLMVAIDDAWRLLHIFERDGNGNIVRQRTTNWAIPETMPPNWEPVDLSTRATLDAFALGSTPLPGFDIWNSRIQVNEYDALNRLLQTVEHGRFLDGAGNPYSTDDRVTTYAYDAAGNRTYMIDPRQFETHTDYDALSRVVRVITADGLDTELTYDAAGNLRRTVTTPPATGSDWPSSIVVEMRYNALNYKYESNEGDGLLRRFSYDRNGNVIETALHGREGAYVIYSHAEYDGRNRKVRDWAPNIAEAHETPRRAVTTYGYDVHDKLVARYEPEATNPWRYMYNAMGVLTDEISPLQERTRHLVDQFGRETGLITAVGDRTLKFYARQGVLVAERDAVGNETRYRYDYFGRLIAKEDPRALGAGGIPNEYTEQYRYDDFDQLVRIERAQGWHLAYDEDDIYAAERSRLGYAWEASDLTASERQQLIDLYSVQYDYDKGGNRTVEITHNFDYLYDESGENDGSVSKPIMVVNSYDAMGRLKDVFRIVNGQIVQTQRHYDPYGNLHREVDAEGREKRWVYGDFARLEREIDEDGNVVAYQYDDYGRVIREYDPNNTTDPNDPEAERFKDIEKSYYADGRLRRVEDHATYAVTDYEYYLNGRLYKENTSVYDGFAGRNMVYTYDGAGRLIRWEDTNPNGNGIHLNTEYRADGLIARRYTDEGYDPLNQANGNSNYRHVYNVYRYFGTGQVSEIVRQEFSANGGFNEIKLAEYDYDEAGNRYRIYEYTPGEADGEEWWYQYDANNRIVSGTRYWNDRSDDVRWAYDAVGNELAFEYYRENVGTGDWDLVNSRQSRYDETGRALAVTSLEMTDADNGRRTISAVTYDRSGRLNQTVVEEQTIAFGFDPVDTQTITYDYTYHGDGRELSVVANGKPEATSYSYYDPNKNRVGVQQSPIIGWYYGMPWQYEGSRFVVDNNGRIIAKEHRNISDATSDYYYYYYDHNGNPVGEAEGLYREKNLILDSGRYRLIPGIGTDSPRTNQVYRVRGGDTLQGLASLFYGNPSLWYVIADANGLDPTQPLQEGRELWIPDTIRTGVLNHEAHAVYNESEIVGSTLPVMLAPPPKQNKCAAVAAIIVAVIVAIVVAVATYGAGSAASGAIIGAAGVGAGSAAAATITLATFAAVGAALGAAGSALRQGIQVGLGVQEDFALGELGIDAAVGGIAGVAQGVGAFAGGAASVGQLSLAGSHFARASASALQTASVAVGQKLRNGKITNFTSLAAASVFGYATASNAIAGGAEQATSPAVRVAPAVAQKTAALSASANRISTVFGKVAIANEYVTPWLQAAETYARESVLTPEDWASVAAGTLTAALTSHDDINGDPWAVRMRQAAMRSVNNMLVAGVVATVSYDAFLGHIASAVGQEIGVALGGRYVEHVRSRAEEKAEEEDAQSDDVRQQFTRVASLGAGDEGGVYDLEVGDVIIYDEHGNPVAPGDTGPSLDPSRFHLLSPAEMKLRLDPSLFSLDPSQNLVAQSGSESIVIDVTGPQVVSEDEYLRGHGLGAAEYGRRIATIEQSDVYRRAKYLEVTPYNVARSVLLGAAEGIYGFWLDPVLQAADIVRAGAFVVRNEFDRALQYIEGGHLESFLRYGRAAKFNPQLRLDPPQMWSGIGQYIEAGNRSMFHSGEASAAETVWRSIPILNAPFALNGIGQAAIAGDWNTVIRAGTSFAVGYTRLAKAVNKYIESKLTGVPYEPRAPWPLNYLLNRGKRPATAAENAASTADDGYIMPEVWDPAYGWITPGRPPAPRLLANNPIVSPPTLPSGGSPRLLLAENPIVTVTDGITVTNLRGSGAVYGVIRLGANDSLDVAYAWRNLEEQALNQTHYDIVQRAWPEYRRYNIHDIDPDLLPSDRLIGFQQFENGGDIYVTPTSANQLVRRMIPDISDYPNVGDIPAIHRAIEAAGLGGHSWYLSGNGVRLIHDGRVGMPVPIRTGSRQAAQNTVLYASLVDNHLHSKGLKTEGYNIIHQGGMETGAFLRRSGVTAMVGVIPQGFEACCPASPYYFGLILAENGETALNNVRLTLRSDRTVVNNNRIVYRGPSGNVVDVPVGVVTADQAGLDARAIEFPAHGEIEVDAWVIPNHQLRFNAARQADMIDMVVGLPDDVVSQAIIGFTDVRPGVPGAIDRFLDPLAYMHFKDPNYRVRAFGNSEFNGSNKEGVENLLPPDQRFSWTRAEHFHEYLRWADDNLKGIVMVIHNDAGKPMEFRMPGRGDGFVLRSEMEYSNFDPLMEMVNTYPNINFIHAHGGGISRSGDPSPIHTSLLRQNFKRSLHGNYYIDMSWDVVAQKIVTQNQNIRNSWAAPGGRGIMNEYADRFIFGSDAVAPKSVGGYMQTMRIYEDSGLLNNLVDRRLFLSGNALRILNPAIDAIFNYRRLNDAALIQRARNLPATWGVLVP